MNEDPIIAETHYINIRALISLVGWKATDKMFTELSEVLQETIRLLPGMEHFSLKYRNILERDMNPDGSMIYFHASNFQPPKDFIIHFNVVKPPNPVVMQENDPKLSLGE